MVNAIVSKEITENIDALAALPIIGSMAAQMAVDTERVADDFDFEDFGFVLAAGRQYAAQDPEYQTVEPLTIGAVAAALAIRFRIGRDYVNETKA